MLGTKLKEMCVCVCVVLFLFLFFFSFCVNCYLLLCLVAKRWVCLVGIDLLLINGGGGFDCENMKFAWLLLFRVCFCFGFVSLGSTCS